MTIEFNNKLRRRARVLAKLANEATGTDNYNEARLAVQMRFVNDHGGQYTKWEVCMGNFCSEGARETIEEALDSLERVITGNT